MVARGSGAAARRAAAVLERPGLRDRTSEANKAAEALQRELALARRFLLQQMLTQQELFDDEDALRRYVQKHMQDHLRALLFARTRQVGGEP